MSSASVFSLQSWTALDERNVEYGEFAPVEFAELENTVSLTSKGFESFDEFELKKRSKRQHLPMHVAEQMEEELEQAKEQERSTIRMTPEELEQRKKEAFDAGYEQARLDVTHSQLEKFEGLERRMNTMLHDIIAQQNRNFTLVEKQALAFATDLAKKLVDQVVEVNPEYIVPLVERSIRLAAGAKITKIRVSPQDYEFLQVIGVHKLFPQTEQELHFEADDSVREGCIVETSAGEIDANLDSAFERIKDSVLKGKRNG